MDQFFLLQAASSNDDSPVLNSLQKLLRGICDPRAMLEDDDENEYDSDGWESSQLRGIISNSPRSQKRASLITPKGMDVSKQNATNTPETMDSSKAPTVDSFSPQSSSNDFASFDDQGNVEVVLSLPPKIQHIEVPIKAEVEMSLRLSSKIESSIPMNQELRPSPSDAAINAMIERIDELTEPSPEEEAHPSDDEINAVIEHIQELIDQNSASTAELVDAGIDGNVDIDTDVETSSETHESICSGMDTEMDALADACENACDAATIIDVPVDVAGESNIDAKVAIDNDIARNGDVDNDCGIIHNAVGDGIHANDIEAVADTQSDDVDQNTSITDPPTDSDTADSDVDLVVLKKMFFPIASGLSKEEEVTNETEEMDNSPKEIASPSSLEQRSRPLKNESHCSVTAAAIKRVLIITAINTVVNLVVMSAGSYCMGRWSPERQQASTSKHRSIRDS